VYARSDAAWGRRCVVSGKNRDHKLPESATASWTAAALCHFQLAGRRSQSARRLAQSTNSRPIVRFLQRIAPMTDTELKTRASLIEQMRDHDDRDSWREFFNRYWKLVYGLAIKSGLTEGEAEEVVQETMVAISKNLDEYQYKPQECSFKSWIFKMAKWRIIDQIRKRPPNFIKPNRAASKTDRTPTVERVANDGPPHLERIWEEEWQHNLMDVALDRVKQKVSIKEFQIFDLYVLKAWPVSEVSKMLHVSAAHAYVTKHRISGLIKKELKKLEGEMG
jgi:RNA polymerase sigma factor (sigma-70 family)